MDLWDLLIRSGSKQAEISGIFEVGNQEFDIGLMLTRNEAFKINEGSKKLSAFQEKLPDSQLPDDALTKLLALSSEPLVLPPFLHFNSYRKIQEGSSSMAEMLEGPRGQPLRFSGPYWRSTSLSEFKGEMLKLFLGRAELFEGADAKDSSEGVKQLNSLLNHYTGGTIEKLKPLPNNGFDFRVSGPGNSGSFAFDGLSSGQKEIVSTLYLIWRHSQNQPCMVLIDEPELHLNAEWHADFVQQLQQYGPRNQYILATHSEHIFEAVEEDRRSFLVASPANV